MTERRHVRAFVAALAAAVTWTGCGAAARAADLVRLGVANDQSSLSSAFGGPGSVLAARMAVEDFGGTVLGRPIKVVVGDTLIKADVTTTFVEEWFDRRGVSFILDGSASSVGLALQALIKQQDKQALGPEFARGLLFTTAVVNSNAQTRAWSDAIKVLAKVKAADLFPTAQESACTLFRDVR